MPEVSGSMATVQVGNPRVQGRCPSCAGSSLFLGDNGYVTCARLDCANPLAADTLINMGRFAPDEAMVKRVAHAIAAVEIRDYDPVATGYPDSEHIEKARAALAVIAEPFEGNSTVGWAEAPDV